MLTCLFWLLWSWDCIHICLGAYETSPVAVTLEDDCKSREAGKWYVWHLVMLSGAVSSCSPPDSQPLLCNSPKRSRGLLLMQSNVLSQSYSMRQRWDSPFLLGSIKTVCFQDIHFKHLPFSQRSFLRHFDMVRAVRASSTNNSMSQPQLVTLCSLYDQWKNQALKGWMLRKAR